jgi:ABC-type transport system involved in cytochrome c biogenesis permease component
MLFYRASHYQKKLNINIKKNIEIMGNLLYVIAVILIIAWAIGFIGYSATGIIHILLVIALIAIILRVIQGKKPIN